MICSLPLFLFYFVFIYIRFIVGLSFGNAIDQNSKDSPESPTTEHPPNLNAVEVILSDEELHMFHDENNCVAPIPPSNPEAHRFAQLSINDDPAVDLEVEATMDECECYFELHEPPHHVPLSGMSAPRFDETSYEMLEIPIERPHCPVPNNRLFMPPHIFNPQMFPPAPYLPYNCTPNVQHELPTPDSSSMRETRPPIYPIPNHHLHFGLTRTYQPPAGNPPAPPRPVNINEPGPSHSRNIPVPGGLSTVPPLAPLSLDIAGSNEQTRQQMSNLSAEFRRVSNIFSRLATAVTRKTCAPLSRPVRRRNPFGRPTGMRGSNASGLNLGPSKAKQLKTKQTIVKSSKPKVANAEQPAAAQPNIGLLTIAPPTPGPTNSRQSNLTLAILKPSMLQYDGRKDAAVQTDPLRYNSFAGSSRTQSTTDAADQLDENANVTNPKPKPNLKRRHPDTNP